MTLTMEFSMKSILFNKIRNVKNPERGYGTADAIDFFIPEYSAEFYEDLKSKNQDKQLYECTVSPNLDNMTITIAPHGRINIPSGIRVIIQDKDTCLLAVNKSGVATKTGLTMGAALVDHDYQGEIHLSVLNTSSDYIKIKTGDKLVQFMHVPILHSSLCEVSTEDFDKLKPDSARKDGAFGSTGIR